MTHDNSDLIALLKKATRLTKSTPDPPEIRKYSEDIEWINLPRILVAQIIIFIFVALMLIIQ